MLDKIKMLYPSSWWHDSWREGLPIGNGEVGANLFGGSKKQFLNISRHDFWIGGKHSEAPDVSYAFLELRNKMNNQDFKEANWEIANALKDSLYKSELEKHVPIAQLVIEQEPIKGFQSFCREIDMQKAEIIQSWSDDSIRMERRSFVSRVNDIVYLKICSDNQNKSLEISYNLSLHFYRNEGESPTELIKEIWQYENRQLEINDKTGWLFFSTQTPTPTSNIKFKYPFAIAEITVNEGTLIANGKSIHINSCNEVTIKIHSGIYATPIIPWSRIKKHLSTLNNDYNSALKESLVEHQKLYNSATLYLGTPLPECSSNETLLMEAFQSKQPLELINKLWRYGRYLFICGCSQNSNPFPLYGLWQGGYKPMWCHNMANENLQMIYWHSLAGNLLSNQKSVFKYFNKKIPSFRDNSQKLFGIDGIYITAGTTPNVTSPTQIVPVILNWIGAAGWILQMYTKYFDYTNDFTFAKESLLPFMNGVLDFYEKFIQFKKTNLKERIYIYPSVSPENTPLNFIPSEDSSLAHPMPTCINSTIDIAIIKEVFSKTVEYSNLFSEIAPDIFSQNRMVFCHKVLASIDDYETNAEGAIKEWQDKRFLDRYAHRHLSHLYPLFPGNEVHPDKTPEKIGMYSKAVKLRKIDAQTGWSLAHMASIYARLKDGKSAMECLDNLAKSSLINNFFTLHNDWRGMNTSLDIPTAPVQLDAIMGYSNAIQEMLFYSDSNRISILPALEKRLFVGKFTNFRYQSGYISCEWDVHKKKCSITINPIRPHTLLLNLPSFIKDWEYSDVSNLHCKSLHLTELDLNDTIVEIHEKRS